MTKKETQEIQKALECIAGGYSYEVKFDRGYVGYVIVENPDFRPDDGSNPKLVLKVYI